MNHNHDSDVFLLHVNWHLFAFNGDKILKYSYCSKYDSDYFSKTARVNAINDVREHAVVI